MLCLRRRAFQTDRSALLRTHSFKTQSAHIYGCTTITNSPGTMGTAFFIAVVEDFRKLVLTLVFATQVHNPQFEARQDQQDLTVAGFEEQGGHDAWSSCSPVFGMKRGGHDWHIEADGGLAAWVLALGRQVPYYYIPVFRRSQDIARVLGPAEVDQHQLELGENSGRRTQHW